MNVVKLLRWVVGLGLMVVVMVGCATTDVVSPTEVEPVVDAPTDTPVPTEVPSETPTDVPEDASVEAPTEAPTETPTEAPTEAPTATPPFSLTSPAFEHEGVIPAKFSCDDQDIAPELVWEGAPEGTASFVLIVDDPDAPVGTWVHWVVYDIPAGTTSLPEAASADGTLPQRALQGQNSWKRADYGGPCPPRGEHRYFFKLYALDTVLGLDPASTKKADVEAAMEGHVLDDVTLMGRYAR